MHSEKPKVLAGFDAGEGSQAGSRFRAKATDGIFCLVFKSRIQSVYDNEHNYFSVKATIYLCSSTNLIHSVTETETAWPDSKQRWWWVLNNLYNE